MTIESNPVKIWWDKETANERKSDKKTSKGISVESKEEMEGRLNFEAWKHKKFKP